MVTTFDSFRTNSVVRDIGLIVGGVMVSNGITSYVPDLQPIWMIVGGLGLSYMAINVQKSRDKQG